MPNIRELVKDIDSNDLSVPDEISKLDINGAYIFEYEPEKPIAVNTDDEDG